MVEGEIPGSPWLEPEGCLGGVEGVMYQEIGIERGRPCQVPPGEGITGNITGNESPPPLYQGDIDKDVGKSGYPDELSMASREEKEAKPGEYSCLRGSDL